MIEEKRPFIAPAGSHEQTPHGTSLFPVANYELLLIVCRSLSYNRLCDRIMVYWIQKENSFL